jgi:hypothetical protein
MKKNHYLLIATLLLCCLTNLVNAQKLPPLDASPADIAIFRPQGSKTTPLIKVIYGRPQMKGRTMIGETEPLGKVWRTGANESTEIKFYKDVNFGDKQVKAGTYTLYSIPGANEFTVILNSKLDTWGAFEYDESKDVARIQAPVSKTENAVEAFTIAFEGKEGTGNMVLAWEKWMVKVPLKY